MLHVQWLRCYCAGRSWGYAYSGYASTLCCYITVLSEQGLWRYGSTRADTMGLRGPALMLIVQVLWYHADRGYEAMRTGMRRSGKERRPQRIHPAYAMSVPDIA
eukprot:707957-Rhodomonas_salina.2